MAIQLENETVILTGEPKKFAVFMLNDDYTTWDFCIRIIESVHRQFRMLTKTKGAFPNDESLLKLLFMGIQNAQKKWTMPIRNWSLTISQLAIHFDGRLDDALGL
jgi:hypothetical protein